MAVITHYTRNGGIIRRAAAAALVLALLAVASPASARFFINKDILNNTIFETNDLTIVLAGVEKIVGHYDRHYQSFSVTTGTNTTLKWSDFNTGSDTTLSPGQDTHVGFATDRGTAAIIDMHFTFNGSQVGPSIINVLLELIPVALNQVDALFHNAMSETATISNVRFLVLSSEDEVALPDLASNNAALEAQLNAPSAALPGGASFDIPASGSVPLSIPLSVPQGSAVVLRYDVTAAGSAADSVDWVQITEIGVEDAPALSGWMIGLLSLVVLALGIGILEVRKRDRLEVQG